MKHIMLTELSMLAGSLNYLMSDCENPHHLRVLKGMRNRVEDLIVREIWPTTTFENCVEVFKRSLAGKIDHLPL